MNMKKILLLFSLSLIPVFLIGQSGDGKNPGTAYYGTISTPITWTYAYNNGVIYVGQTGNEDLTVGNSGSLTIEPGIKVIFCKPGSDLLISGTGSLTADGTAANKITFTRYYPTNTYWGHISFGSTSLTSVLDNCIIEYGDVRGNAGSAKYGGGIYCGFNNLTISNCSIQYNKAEWGGGLFVDQFKSPYIKNCYFYGNYSKEGGGGIYLWNGASSLIENCIFEANHSAGTTYSFYTGGGLGSQSSGSNKVVNCTFVNNTSGRTDGKSLMFYSSTNDIAINCIFWGAGNHIYSSGTYSITYCATQGTAPPGTGNFVLNAVNNDPAGPNFTSLTDRNWYISPWSPCVNVGLDHSSDPDVPLLDYNGKQRVGQTDIGANESWGFYWTGSDNANPTVWNNASNWYGNTIPAGDEDVLLPGGLANYPVSTSSQNYTINTGRSLILAPGAKATFGTLSNNGTLKLESDATNISTLITDSYSGSAATVELYLTGGGGSSTYKWHYVSSPVSALPVNTFILKPAMDFAQYFESRPSSNPMQGWVAYDGYVYSGAYYLTGLPYVISGTNLNVGQGYNYYYASDYKFTFSGQLNVSSISPTITCGINPLIHGFNLLGNPFSSGLDWTTIINDAGFPTLTSKGLYFTRNNTQCSYIAGVGYPDASVTGIIPPMQGFFIHTTNTSTTLPLLAGARAHNIPARYKGKGEIIPLVRLQLDNDTIKDNTVVRFDSKAEATLDNDFDAVRMFLSDEIQYIYSTDGVTKYAINGQPFPETTLQIPLSVNILTSGNHSITASQLQGLESYNVGLKDNTTGFTADLKSNPAILFSSDAGIFTGRFVLVVSGSTTAIPEYPNLSEKAFNIYYYQNMLNIQTLGDEWDGKKGSISIYNLTGKITGSEQNVEFYENSLIQIPANLTKGVYVVEINSGVQRYAGKVVIR